MKDEPILPVQIEAYLEIHGLTEEARGSKIRHLANSITQTATLSFDLEPYSEEATLSIFNNLAHTISLTHPNPVYYPKA